ncbi:hypothetical protein LUZ60_001506 [Juncus effusus]|nr:hypothetical protein LUZ60_001506 [Juncus effusus]
MKRTNFTEEEERHLSGWASLVLPYLAPPDLAAVAGACRTFRCLTAGVTSRRAADAARGLELHPIPFIPNPHHPYSYFVYTTSSIVSPSSPFSQPWGGEEDSSRSNRNTLRNVGLGVDGIDEAGCDCEEECNEGNCSCLDETKLGILIECGDRCKCGETCENRKTHRGIRVKVTIIRDPRKGWALRAAELIQQGQFVCEYAGEYLTTEETRKRQKTYDQLSQKGKKISPALLVLREHLPSGKACLRVNIDATKIGNIARFINHSCDGGNLNSVLVRNPGFLLPRLCFFASRDILEGEEVCFSYGEGKVGENEKGIACFCGSFGCKGVLPSEET